METNTNNKVLTKESFLEVGFILDKENPIFPFTMSLAVESEVEDEDEYLAPELGYCTSMSSFFVSDPNGTLMYFNAETPKEAVEWASKITSFELNF